MNGIVAALRPLARDFLDAVSPVKPWPALLILEYAAYGVVIFLIRQIDGNQKRIGIVSRPKSDAAARVLLAEQFRARGEAAYNALAQATEALFLSNGNEDIPDIRNAPWIPSPLQILFGEDFAAIWHDVPLHEGSTRRYDLVADPESLWLTPALVPAAEGLFRLARELLDGERRLLYLHPLQRATLSAHERLSLEETFDVLGRNVEAGLGINLAFSEGLWMRRAGAHALIARGRVGGENRRETDLCGVLPLEKPR